MVFSDTVNNLGLVQQVRSLARVDSTRWPTYKIVNSVNNYLDTVAGFMIASDKRFQWDDTNHTKLPEGTIDLTINQSDFSFMVDENSNKILTLTGVSILQGSAYKPLIPVDKGDEGYNALTFGTQTGIATRYDKIADNIVRLDFKSASTISAGIKFFFQRTPSYFTAADTTKEPGVPALLHRGFVIASAYDCALTLGLKNLQALGLERQVEEKKMEEYFAGRNNDVSGRMVPNKESNK